MSAQINDWSDIHFAYQVAKHGTLSAAAQALGVHHSTVLRRIDALEKRLNTRLFHRHARGYTPTAAGQMLLSTADRTQQEFDLLLGQLEGADEQISGTLVVTTVSSFTELLTPLIAEFQLQYPEIVIEYVADSRIFKLEYGEAHVSVRPGAQPEDPDYVVQSLRRTESTLYASPDYVKRLGMMNDIADIGGHRFISTVSKLLNVPSMAWLETKVPEKQIFFRASDLIGARQAVEAGMGISPLPSWLVEFAPALIPMFKPPEDWYIDLWLVTHRDIHRTAKVQAFTQFLKMKLR